MTRYVKVTILRLQEPLLEHKVDCTMEDLDVYMRKIGWYPTIYDLTRTAKRNEWMRIRYFDKDKLSLKRRYFGVKAAMRFFLDKLLNHQVNHST